MAEIHILNVGQGDCAIIQSNSGHVTMFDICGGNISAQEDRSSLTYHEKAAVLGNYRMCQHPTNPIAFLKNKIGKTSIFRFILSHPDMDHLDGFNKLISECAVSNFWDSGVRRDKPNFKGSPYKEEDWDRYVKVRDGNEDGIKVVSPISGSKNKYYNKDDNGKGGDYIYVYAPTKDLVDCANKSDDCEDVNNASYVIVYRTAGGRILLPGDAHDKTWEHVIENYESELLECELMLAPHHGRDSDRSWDFLEKIKPQFSVLGCASSKHLAYDAWNRRGLEKITQNQAGNIAVYPDSDGLSVYVENDRFAQAYGGDTSTTDKYGNCYLTYIKKLTNIKSKS